MPQQQHEYLTNCILIVIVCGVIIAYVGNYMIQSSNINLNSANVTTCNTEILSKLSGQGAQEGENGYLIAFTGNIITAAGILFLLLLSALFSINNSGSTASTFTKIKNMMLGSLPSLLTLGIITYIIILSTIHKENLISGRVANQYYTYSSFSSILVLMQVGLLIKYMTNMSNNKDSSVHHVIYVFSVINIMILGIIQIILQFFSTDG